MQQCISTGPQPPSTGNPVKATCSNPFASCQLCRTNNQVRVRLWGHRGFSDCAHAPECRSDPVRAQLQNKQDWARLWGCKSAPSHAQAHLEGVFTLCAQLQNKQDWALRGYPGMRMRA